MDTARYDQYMSARVGNNEMSPGTKRKYDAAIARFREWWGGAGAPRLEDFQDYLLSRAADDDVAGSTLNVEKCAFGKWLSVNQRAGDTAQLREWFSDNFSVASGGTSDYLDEEELAAVREAAAEDPRDGAMVAIMSRTGIRANELVALDTADVDFTPLSEGAEGGEIGAYVEIERSKRQEVVLDQRSLTARQAGLVDAYIDATDCYGPREAVGSDALFITSTPTRVDSEGVPPVRPDFTEEGVGYTWRPTMGYVRKRVTAIGERTDHPDVDGDRLHPHLFRHTVGSLLGQSGHSADEIGAYLGKASPAERYTHFDTEQHEEMATALP